MPIPKKGNLADLKNWRPICLLSVVTKIFDRVLYERISVLDGVLRHNQAGFRKYRSIDECKATLTELLGRARRFGVPLVTTFVDFQKAFPSVSWAAVRAALRAFGVPPTIEGCILSLYNSSLRACVRTPDGTTDFFPIATGTLQGDVLAPFLFILVLDRILFRAIDNAYYGGIQLTPDRSTRSRSGHKCLFLRDIDYADDLILVTHSIFDAQHLLSRLEVEAARANLHINVGVDKTAFMMFGTVLDDDKELRLLSGHTVPHVDRYRYLGLYF